MRLLDVLTGQEYNFRLITIERNFDLGVPPTMLFVEVVRRNNLA